MTPYIEKVNYKTPRRRQRRKYLQTWGTGKYFLARQKNHEP